jgi:hypothetical protein
MRLMARMDLAPQPHDLLQAAGPRDRSAFVLEPVPE